MNQRISQELSRRVSAAGVFATSVLDIASPPLFLDLGPTDLQFPLHLKIEALNVAGSIKFKTAATIIQDLESGGLLHAGKRVIESSSGNLGLALAIICASKGYPFICVSDPNISPTTAALIRAYGAELIIVERRDAYDGFLQERIATIKRMIAADTSLVWTNQYANPSNKRAHYSLTGAEILKAFPDVQAVFVGAGTTGTLMGCSQYLREHSPSTIIVAVDSVGSVLFSDAPGKRYLPGLGASRVPELLDKSLIDEVVLIEERETVLTCRAMAKQYGLLLGASSGTVLAGVRKSQYMFSGSRPVVAVSPDLGDRYIDTLYCDEWVQRRYGALTSPSKSKEAAATEGSFS